jgi:MFS family permease
MTSQVSTRSASYFSGRLAERFPADRLMGSGMVLSAVGICGLTSIESLWIYTPLSLLTGVGLGLGWALASVATQAVVPPSAAGVTPTLARDARRRQRCHRGERGRALGRVAAGRRLG